MKNKIIFPVLLILISLLMGCEKVEERVYISDQIAPPELVSVPDLELKRDNANDSLAFIGTLIDPGFKASIKYSLQVRPAGDLKAKPSSIFSSNVQDTLMKLSVADLNKALLAKSPAFIPTALDFLIRAELISSADARGVDPIFFLSSPRALTVTTYGPPRLDLIDSGKKQSLDTYADGEYSGEIDLLQNSPFTLFNPETQVEYGGSDGTLVVNGPAIVPPADGEFQLIVNIDDMTYEFIRISAAVMNVLDSGTDQDLTSATGNGIYSGLILMDVSMPFTLLEVDNGNNYGGSEGTLILDGIAIVPGSNGWHMATVNVNDMTYVLDPYSVAVVGAFTEWGTLPDIPMDYNPEEGFWFVTVDLPAGPMKFRLNSAWDIRWGPGVNTDLPAEGGTMVLPNSDADINITAAGNYTIELTITSNTTGSAKFILN